MVFSWGLRVRVCFNFLASLSWHYFKSHPIRWLSWGFAVLILDLNIWTWPKWYKFWCLLDALRYSELVHFYRYHFLDGVFKQHVLYVTFPSTDSSVLIQRHLFLSDVLSPISVCHNLLMAFILSPRRHFLLKSRKPFRSFTSAHLLLLLDRFFSRGISFDRNSTL